jgi:hypothetical protein
MKQKFNRDDLLTDLREHICEIFVPGTSVRCTLKPEDLPQSYLLTEEAKERQFHAANPKIISAWDVVNGGWKQFHVDSISYIQVVDTY